MWSQPSWVSWQLHDVSEEVTAVVDPFAIIPSKKKILESSLDMTAWNFCVQAQTRQQEWMGMRMQAEEKMFLLCEHLEVMMMSLWRFDQCPVEEHLEDRLQSEHCLEGRLWFDMRGVPMDEEE